MAFGFQDGERTDGLRFLRWLSRAEPAFSPVGRQAKNQVAGGRGRGCIRARRPDLRFTGSGWWLPVGGLRPEEAGGLARLFRAGPPAGWLGGLTWAATRQAAVPPRPGVLALASSFGLRGAV